MQLLLFHMNRAALEHAGVNDLTLEALAKNKEID